MQKLSLFQRFAANTPKFEKGIQFLALICAALLAYASKLGYVPVTVFDVLSGAFGGIAVVCQFAYEHDAEIKALIADPSQALQMIPQLHDQVQQLAEAIKNPPQATLLSIEQVAEAIKPLPVVQHQDPEIKTPVDNSAPADPGLSSWAPTGSQPDQSQVQVQQ